MQAQLATKLSPITKIAIVDDQQVLREGLAALLGQQKDMKVVGQYASVQETLEQMSVRQPDMLLLDLVMPGPSVFSLIQHIKKFHQATKVVCLTGYPSDTQCQKAFKAGADGFISKCVSGLQLSQMMRKIGAGNRIVFTPGTESPAELSKSLDDMEGSDGSEVPLRPVPTLQGLTKREVEVLYLVANGQTAKTIAKSLFISKRTVDRHKTNLMTKLNVRSQLELALRFRHLASTQP